MVKASYMYIYIYVYIYIYIYSIIIIYLYMCGILWYDDPSHHGNPSEHIPNGSMTIPHFLCTLPKIWPSHIHHIYNIWNHHPGAGHLCRSSVCLNGAWWPTLVYLNILNGAGEVFPRVYVFLGQTTQIVVVSCWLWILFGLDDHTQGCMFFKLILKKIQAHGWFNPPVYSWISCWLEVMCWFCLDVCCTFNIVPPLSHHCVLETHRTGSWVAGQHVLPFLATRCNKHTFTYQSPRLSQLSPDSHSRGMTHPHLSTAPATRPIDSFTPTISYHSVFHTQLSPDMHD